MDVKIAETCGGAIMKVTECIEAWKEEPEGSDDWRFDHFSIILVNDADFFKARSPKALAVNQNIDIAELDYPLIRIPTEHIWPPLENNLTLVPLTLSDGTYHKMRSLIDYESQPNSIKPRDLILHEARICEILRNNPHKNVASYLGCISADGLLKGLCFVRYSENLSDRLNHPDRPLNVSGCLEGIKDGLDHLHSLGLNHNDINPMNIMLDEYDVPIIIDFDSCGREGDIPLCNGTPGWTEGNMITKSERRNDDFALEQLRILLLSHSKSNSTQ
ncbi:MAG: hypothetical protein LQ349_003085 [Xanthoria aureola]|nr:MAG: hypothetical protein LQ349_003085 [Xanthoria aureola]